MTDPCPRNTHDLGGVEPWASQPIDRHDHALSDFDKQVDALLYLLLRRSTNALSVDKLRREIEAMKPDAYFNHTYYEKWLDAITALLLESDILDEEEIVLKCAELREAAGRR